jgi:hypothetical protein
MIRGSLNHKKGQESGQQLKKKTRVSNGKQLRKA